MKRRVKVLLLGALCVCLSFALCGCEQQQKEPIDQKDLPRSGGDTYVPLQIDESGYWIDASGVAHYAVIICNPNPDWTAERVDLRVAARDKDGKVVGNQTDCVDLLYGNGKTAICGMASFNDIEDLEFSLVDSTGTWEKVDMQQAEFDEVLYVESIDPTTDGYGSLTVGGEIANKSDLQFDLVNINVVFRDSEGKIVGGDMTYVETLYPDSITPYTLYAFEVPEYSRIEAYIQTGITIEQ